MPHVGTAVPAEIEASFSEDARALPDTDWHVDRLYNFLDELDCSWIAAKTSRYVIDLNRRIDGAELYAGSDNTELCPRTTFDREAIYLPGEEPDAIEIDERVERFWRPYHAQLETALREMREEHGKVLLWEAHSIRSRVPRFFEGRLPDLNFGSGGGSTAAPELLEILSGLASESGYSQAVNGRFKGGAITRLYGDPASGVHAVQLELAQVTYMNEAPPYEFREDLAEKLRPLLRRLLEAALDWLG
jgi:N-formylglutamate deformylase